MVYMCTYAITSIYFKQASSILSPDTVEPPKKTTRTWDEKNDLDDEEYEDYEEAVGELQVT